MAIIKEAKYPLENLFIAHIGLKSSNTTYSKETIICERITIKEYYEKSYKYKDILTGTIYKSINNRDANIGEAIAFNAVSLASIFKPSEYRDKIFEQGYVTKKQLIEIYNSLNEDNGYVITIEKKVIDFPECCTIMNKKMYKHQPTYLRTKELESLMISLAMNKKIALIVGGNGTGRTALVDQLAYLIQHNQVPDFLKQQIVLEINIPNLKSDQKNKKSLEKRIKEIIEYTKEKKAILFIDEADDILIPTKENDENINITAMLMYAAERENLKIIATVNSNQYNKYNDNKYQQRFEEIKINEPEEKELINIISNVFNDLKNSYEISLNSLTDLEDIALVLIESTKTTTLNMVTNEKNPGLVLSIIDTSFAIARSENEKSLNYNHIIKAIEKNKNLEKGQAEKATKVLEELKYSTTKEQAKKLILSIKEI